MTKDQHIYQFLLINNILLLNQKKLINPYLETNANIIMPPTKIDVKSKDIKETKESKVSKDTKDIKNTKEKEIIESKDIKETKDKETKNVKITKSATEEKISKKKVEEEEIDDDDDSDDDSEDDDEDDDDKDKKQTKEKKPKKTFQELSDDFEKISEDIKTCDKEIIEIEKNLKAKEKQKYDLERQRGKIYSQFSKSHEDEVKKAAKEKPKRKGNKDGGFNKESPVPPKLISYLSLEKDVRMARPKVMSLLNDKFKADKLKDGQITTLDKKAAKALGKDEGRVIEFTAFQSFLKEFYDDAFPNGVNNTVEL